MQLSHSIKAEEKLTFFVFIVQLLQWMNVKVGHVFSFENINVKSLSYKQDGMQEFFMLFSS